MTKTLCPADEWTTVPDTGGQMWLQARQLGFYVDTSGSPPVDPEDAHVIPDGADVVIGAGLVVNVWPKRLGRAEYIWSQVI